MSALMTSTLISQLAQYGVAAQVIHGELKVRLPQVLPPEARPLLKELKKSLGQDEAYKLFESASVRASETFSPAAWDWAKAHRPELVNAILTAEQEFSAAYRVQDMAGCREAVQRYEQGFVNLNDTYLHREPDP